MQTVITWRRPMDASLYAPSGNPCAYLLGNALCYIISGMMLLVVGVIITSLTFQNLEAYRDENKERYAGPVLIGAGVLVLARGAFSKLRPPRSHLARRRSFLRRYVREMYRSPILAFRNSASFSLCDLQVSDIQDSSSSRTRLYSDEPPPYDLVTSDHYLNHHLNPHPDPESPHQHHYSDGPHHNDNANDYDDEVFNAGYSSDDYLQPPPHYEDFIRETESIRTTRL